MNRRDFIKKSTLVSSSVFIPNFLFANQEQFIRNNNRLIIIQLSGGNDGLNTVVPIQNDMYYNARTQIALKQSDVIPLSDTFGFHPSLTSFAKYYERGELAMYNGVGYPNPNRSHFRSMDIWHTASDSTEYIETGWLGRLIDNYCYDELTPVIDTNKTLSLISQGKHSSGILFHQKKSQNKTNPALELLKTELNVENQTTDYLYKCLRNSLNASEYIEQKIARYNFTDKFPNHDLGRQLNSIAHLIAAGMSTTVYYASLGSFDTHVNQLGTQARLLNQLDKSVDALIASLKKNNEWNNTCIFIFSEFGRRIKENGSRGTDHGAGNLSFILSGSLAKAGLLNQMPDLEHHLDGDINLQVDFRSIYATLLERQLGYDSKSILGNQFSVLDFF